MDAVRITELARRFGLHDSVANLAALADREAAAFRDRLAAMGVHVTIAQARAALDNQNKEVTQHGNV